MKVQMYSVRPDEDAAIKKNAAELGATIDTVSHDFTPADIPSLAGHDVLCLAQHGAIGSAEDYAAIAAAGVKHIALRITGYDIIDLAAAAANHLKVTNVPAYSPRSVGEMTLTHAMVLVRHLNETRARMAAGDYSWGGMEAEEIHTLTVGIIGVGKIGSAVARLFYALGATIIANDPIHRPELSDVLTYVDKDELLQTADIVTVHTPLDDTTHHLIDADALAKMKSTAIILNCARGPIVDTDALIAALENKTIAAAGLDSIEDENGIFGDNLTGKDVPNARLLKLQTMANVSLSPHMAFYTRPAVENMVAIALHDADTIYNGGVSEHEIRG
ncbi:NAD(P)-dependent oxidoreductase [Lacticaseibacillus baoqingensis]|uniref:NAD(P)-dependent oxidoreductase n=1 Tax=Lacticaseibacillus baoqingensis TaxID=2486013 RepID=A0ABW4E6K9_9LACO|nr:NAD(P)-dependent oxidoreductase [Lacticaseibacillus baoqingensis]